MAKRKKLNRQVVVFLTIAGVILVAGALAYLLPKLPKDAEALAARARAAAQKGDFKAAELAWVKTIGVKEKPEYFYEAAKAAVEIAKAPGTTEAERTAKYRQAIGRLQAARRADPTYVDAQRLITELYTPTAGQRYITEADRLIALVPDDHEAYYNRATAKAILADTLGGQYLDSAVADFRKAVELKPDEPKYWRELAKAYQIAKRYEEAAQTFEQAIAAVPDDPDTRVLYAAFLRGRDNGEAARKQIEAAIQRAPQSAVGYRAMAAMQMLDDQMDQALETLQAAKAADPTDFQVYAMIAELYKRQRKHQEASQAIRDGIEAITLKLKGADEEKLLPRRRASLEYARTILHNELANRLLDLIDQDAAAKDQLLPEVKASYDKMRQSLPDSPQTAKISGRIALLEGDEQKAIEELEKADEGFQGADPQVADKLIRLYYAQSPGKAQQILDRYLKMPQYASNASLLYLRAQIEGRYRNYDAAMRFVDKALAIDPDLKGAKDFKAELLTLTGKASLPEGTKLTERSLGAIADRASSLWQEGKRDEAITIMADAHRRLPESLPVTQQLMTMYIANGQLDQGKELLAEAQRRFPDNERLKATAAMMAEPDPDRRLQMHLEFVEKMSSDPLQVALGKALVYFQAGKRAEYLEQLKTAEKANPDFPPVVDMLFKEAINERDWQAAGELAERAAKVNLDGVKGYVYRAQVLASQKEYPKAIELLKSASKELPNSKPILTSLGECYLRTGQNEAAREAFAVVAEMDPSSFPALVGMAQSTSALGKTDESAEWVIKAHRIAPNDPTVQRMYMEIQEATTSPQESIAARQKVLQQKPNDADNIFRLGQLYERTKQPDKAEEMYKALWVHPDTDKIAVARLLAGLYRSQGRYTDGQKVLDQLLEKTDDKVLAYAAWGEFYAPFDPAAAKNALQKAIDADPKDERGYLAMAEFLVAQGQWSQAADALEQFLAIHPDSPTRRTEMITYLVQSGQLDRAEKLVDQLLGKAPSDPKAMVLKAVIDLQRDDPDKALKLLDAVIAKTPGAFEALYYRAQIYRSKGLIEEAKRDLEGARSISPNPQFTMDLAAVMLGLGDRASARQLYKEILESRPGFKPAIGNLLDLCLIEKRWQDMEALLADAKAKLAGDPWLCVYEARMWQARGQADKAIAALDPVVASNPGYLPATRMYLGALIAAGQHQRLATAVEAHRNDPACKGWIDAYLAEDLAKQGKTAQADEIFVGLLRDAGDEARMTDICAQLAGAYGPGDAAEKLTGWIPQIRPDDWRLYYQIAGLHRMNGQSLKARDNLMKALALADSDTDKGRVQRNLGMAYSLAGMTNEAVEAYRKALEALPDDPTSLNDLAYIYTDRMDRAGDAVPLARKAATALPTNGGVIDTYGWALAKFGKLLEAEQQLGRALQLSPYVPEIRYHLGWVYQQKGQMADAEREYKQALEMIKDDPSHALRDVLPQALSQVRQQATTQE